MSGVKGADQVPFKVNIYLLPVLDGTGTLFDPFQLAVRRL